MPPLLHSAFLQALGYAIVNSLWQLALLWLLYFLVNSAFKLSSDKKYVTGLVLELVGFSWFIVTLIFYYGQSSVAVEGGNGIVTNLPTDIFSTTHTVKQTFFLWVLRSEQFFPYLSVAYLALLFILAIRWLTAYQHTQLLRITGLAEIDEQWKSFVERLSKQIGVKRKVSIYVSELVQTPLTVGFLKPLILVPLATLNYLNPQQMEAVIIHELAHIRRYDYLFNLVLALIEATLFFNPFIQLIHQQVKKERENCCDDWVLKYDYCASSYATALLQIASHQNIAPLLALKATETKELLINRIKRLIEKKEHRFFNHKYQLLALLVLTTVFSSVSLLSPGKKIKTAPSTSLRGKVVFEPVAAKVTNPLFSPVFFLAKPSKTTAQITVSSGETKKLKEPSRVQNTAVAAPPEPSAPPIPEDGDNEEIQPFNEFPVSEHATDVENKPLTVAIKNKTGFVEPGEQQRRIFRHHCAKSFSIDTDKQRGLIDRQEKNTRFQAALAERTIELDLDKIRPQIKNILEQIKSEKNTAALIKLDKLIKAGMEKIERETQTQLKFSSEFQKLAELELLEKQIGLKIVSFELGRFSSNPNNDLMQFNIQTPAVLYTFSFSDKDHPFSFQYSAKPRVRVANPPVLTNCPKKIKERKEKVVLMEDEQEEENTIEESYPATPPAPPVKFRTVQIIRI